MTYTHPPGIYGVALRASRGHLRAAGIEPQTAAISDYEAALDELSRQRVAAGNWYANATPAQWKRFVGYVQTWQRWANGTR